MWLGRKTDSEEYRRWNKQAIRLLPEVWIPDGPLSIYISVFYKSKLSDLDNAFKPFLDLLQKRYRFDDRRVFHIRARKLLVDTKEQERIEFCIEEYNGPTHQDELY